MDHWSIINLEAIVKNDLLKGESEDALHSVLHEFLCSQLHDNPGEDLLV
jgi:hypothetical protein